MEKKGYLDQLETGDTRVDLEKADKDLARHEKLLENLRKEWSVKLREFDLVDQKGRLLVPKYEYHEDDEYWAIQKEYRALEKSRQEIEQEDKELQLEKVILAKSDEVKRLKGEMK